MSTVSLSASQSERDPNGDGKLYFNDVIYIKQALSGSYKPTSLGKLDFDGNGIVSAADADKLQRYLIGLYDNVFTTNTELEKPNVASVRSYVKHECNNNNASSYSIYQLTTESDDNRNNNRNAINLYDMDRNDQVLCANEAVVKLSTSTYYRGTGFIIGDNIVATAAHCVYDKKSGTFYDFSVDIIGEDGQKIKSYQPASIHVPLEYANNTDDGLMDFALIYLEDVDQNENGVVDGKGLTRHGKFNLGLSMDSLPSKNTRVTVCGFPSKDGYPDGYQNTEDDEFLRFEAEGNLVGYDTYNNCRLVYKAYTHGGHSGGPVYVTETYTDKNGDEYSYKTVIGIHHSGSGIDNFGYRFTPEILTFLLKNTQLK